MTHIEAEEKLRQLAAVDETLADHNWKFYLSGEGPERERADNLLDVQLYQRLGKDYQEQVFLKPAPPDTCCKRRSNTGPR